MSSEVIACSFPGIPGSDGLPPVAISIYLAVTTSGIPSLPVSSTSWGESSLACLLKYLIF